MKIVETKKGVIVRYNKVKDKDLTWRKVKIFCKEQIEKIDNSKENEDIIAIQRTIELLQKKVDTFKKKRNKFQRMYNNIKDTDKDLDIPFGKEEE